MAANDSKDKGDKQAVARTIQIIRALAGHEFDGLLLGQVAQACDLHPSTALGYLEALVYHGIVARDTRNPKLWRLGPALVQIAIAFQAHLAAKQRELDNFAHNYTRHPH
jgi:DNA-binding IclR family transcriptional regulator